MIGKIQLLEIIPLFLIQVLNNLHGHQVSLSSIICRFTCNIAWKPDALTLKVSHSLGLSNSICLNTLQLNYFIHQLSYLRTLLTHIIGTILGQLQVFGFNID